MMMMLSACQPSWISMKTYTLLELTSDQPIPHATHPGVAIEWSGAKHDILGAWDKTQPTRLTIPKGIRKARLSAGAVFESNPNGFRQIYSKLNGSDVYPIGYLSHTLSSHTTLGSSTSFATIGPWIDVKPDDYWELFAVQDSGGTLAFRGVGSSWFQMEFI